MNTRNIQYSLKNIPIPSSFSYLKNLINKTKDFVRRLRWKAFWYNKKLEAQKRQNNSNDDENNEEEEIPNNYGFRSPRNPPQNDNLKEFEANLFKLKRLNLKTNLITSRDN